MQSQGNRNIILGQSKRVDLQQKVEERRRKREQQAIEAILQSALSGSDKELKQKNVNVNNLSGFMLPAIFCIPALD